MTETSWLGVHKLLRDSWQQLSLPNAGFVHTTQGRRYPFYQAAFWQKASYCKMSQIIQSCVGLVVAARNAILNHAMCYSSLSGRKSFRLTSPMGCVHLRTYQGANHTFSYTNNVWAGNLFSHNHWSPTVVIKPLLVLAHWGIPYQLNM